MAESVCAILAGDCGWLEALDNSTSQSRHSRTAIRRRVNCQSTNAQTNRTQSSSAKPADTSRASGWANVPNAASGIRWSKSASLRRRRARGAKAFSLREAKAIAYAEIESQDDTRVSSGVTEFDRVLGGGIVPGTLVLLGGDPGIGKSTLLLQVADKLSANGANVLYVSGEESERQIKLRGERLRIAAPNLLLLPETNLENIFHEIERVKPSAIIVDSIQTTFSSEIESAPGSVSQVREVAAPVAFAREELAAFRFF